MSWTPGARAAVMAGGASLPPERRKNAGSEKEGSPVSGEEIDRYLSGIEEPKRTTLERLRQSILKVVPDAEEGISYGMPAFRVRGKVVAGFAAFKNHLTYAPHSGSVLDQLADDLEGYSTTKGVLRFPVDEPLPDTLVEKLVQVRLRQAFGDPA